MRKVIYFFLFLVVVVANDKVYLQKRMLFEKNSYSLSKETKEFLDKLAPLLKNQKSLKNRKFLIKGYADSSGTERFNFNLSKKRACEVRDYLVKKHKISKNRFQCKGYGSSNPIADNSTQTGRMLNRRAIITKLEITGALSVKIKYKYDKLGRLIKATYSNGKVVQFEYDSLGNILKRKEKWIK